jgi:putative ATP-dependent endonuclease of the OLD family
MYLSKLVITNFRHLADVTLDFVPGLNVILGPNNIGKSAVVDALRSLLAGHEDPYPKITADDVHRPKDGTVPSGDIVFEFVFSGLSAEDEADFLSALMPIKDNEFEAHIGIRFNQIDQTGRMRIKRWCGQFEDVGLNSDMLENLRGVYLQPLRDASKGLKPGRNSQLARLMRLLGEDDKVGKENVETLVEAFETELQKQSPLIATGTAISTRHKTMLGDQLSQALALGISGSDFNRLSGSLSLMSEGLEIDCNGLGYNNLIYMAVVLSEMVKDPTAAYRGLIIEEPEAHLHPQLQVVLLEYLKTIKKEEGEGDVQLFVTSHSSNFASIAKLNSLTCLVEHEGVVKSYFPRNAKFSLSPAEHKKKQKKLERYLDITRAELFFARRVVFVEGAAELMLVSALAKRAEAGFDLRQHGVSIISVEGLNFDCFLPLFGHAGLPIPVSVITDGDPAKEDDSSSKTVSVYPDLNDEVDVSDNTQSLINRSDDFISVFYGVKTLEYDLALHECNRNVMLDALADTNPGIAKALRMEVATAGTNQEKAKALFCGMFERGSGLKNIQKGRFAQALAYQLSQDAIEFIVPDYITNAVKHVCK